MDDFYKILELIYKFNIKYPEIRFGQLMHNLTLKSERLFYMENKDLVLRLEEVLKDDNDE